MTPAPYLSGGLPYARFGRGRRPLVVFPGLGLENKPERLMARGMYGFLGRAYTVYSIARRPNLPRGYSLRAMADDYARMIEAEFGGPVDIIGVSTGGSIAHVFAGDHPDLVDRLVLHSSAHTLNPGAKAMQLEVARLAAERRWREVWSVMLRFALPPGVLTSLFVALVPPILALSAPKDPSDLIVTVEAEDRFDYRDCLALISAPTLVIAGDCDPAYSPQLFRTTAAGIPDARLILYPRMGHPAKGRQFAADVLSFLCDDGERGAFCLGVIR